MFTNILQIFSVFHNCFPELNNLSSPQLQKPFLFPRIVSDTRNDSFFYKPQLSPIKYKHCLIRVTNLRTPVSNEIIKDLTKEFIPLPSCGDKCSMFSQNSCQNPTQLDSEIVQFLLNADKYIILCRMNACFISKRWIPNSLPKIFIQFRGIWKEGPPHLAGNPSHFHAFCSDSRNSLFPGSGIHGALMAESCALVTFTQLHNMSVVAEDEDMHRQRFDGIIDFEILGKFQHLHASLPLDVASYGESYDGLSYAIYVNRTELLYNLFLSEPFDLGVWGFFLFSGCLTAIFLSILGRRKKQFLKNLFWTFTAFLEQTEHKFENASRFQNTPVSIILAIWSLMMIVLTNSYADSIYSFLLSEQMPALAEGWSSLSGLETVFSFQNSNPHRLTSIQEYLNTDWTGVNHTWANKVRVIHNFHYLHDAVISLAWSGKVNGTRIPSIFGVIQKSQDLESFSLQMKATGQFAQVRNEGAAIFRVRSGWFVSQGWVGEVFVRGMKGFVESGIYSWWKWRYQRFVNVAGVAYVKRRRKKGELKGVQNNPNSKDGGLTRSQLSNCFVLIVGGVGLSLFCCGMEMYSMLILKRKIEN